MSGPVAIDLMALADIGQPKRLAFEIHKQLRAQFGSVPLRIPLDSIAAAVGIVGIEEHDTTAFEGALVVDGNQGAIGLKKGMQPGRRNFTIGHELGHFLVPTHRLSKTSFECTPQYMRYKRGTRDEWERRPSAERIEVEANEFSAALLVAIPEYRNERGKLGRGCDVAHIRPLAEAFAVSQEMMASVYVAHEHETTAIVTSNNGKIRRVIPKTGFPFMGLHAGMEIPRGSLTRDFRAGNCAGDVSKIDEVDIHTWIETKGNATSLCEQVILQRDGWAITLLTVEEDEGDDEADDSNWNRRNRPTGAYH